jgi:hypothetical protein
MSYGVEGQEVRKILAQFDAPAFVRRARAVEVADELLHARLAPAYAEGLEMPRLRLAQLLAALAHQDALLKAIVPQPGLIPRLRAWAELHPVRLRIRVAPASDSPTLAPRWQRLVESVGRFNRRWHRLLSGIDLADINHLRAEYNRWYEIEKEAATHSPELARQGFEYRPPLTVADLLRHYPVWPDWLAPSPTTPAPPGDGTPA